MFFVPLAVVGRQRIRSGLSAWFMGGGCAVVRVCRTATAPARLPGSVRGCQVADCLCGCGGGLVGQAQHDNAGVTVGGWARMSPRPRFREIRIRPAAVAAATTSWSGAPIRPSSVTMPTGGPPPLPFNRLGVDYRARKSALMAHTYDRTAPRPVPYHHLRQRCGHARAARRSRA